MKIKFNDEETFKNFKGNDLKDSNKDPITLRSACIDALLANPPDDRANGKEKVRRFELAQKLSNVEETEFDISVEDLSLIKSMAGKAFVTVAIGRMFEALEKGKIG